MQSELVNWLIGEVGEVCEVGEVGEVGEVDEVGFLVERSSTIFSVVVVVVFVIVVIQMVLGCFASKTPSSKLLSKLQRTTGELFPGILRDRADL